MASTVGSTAASLTDRTNQDGINLCVTVMLQMIIRDPWITVDEILNYLLWIGPHGNTRNLMRMFGGRWTFQQTLERLDIVRQATIQNRLHELPITVERFDGTFPEIPGNIQLWAPQVSEEDHPFSHAPPGDSMEWEPLNRYPHEGVYTDDLWEEQEAEEADFMDGLEGEEASEEEIDDNFNMARSEAST